ncbi:MAG: hypothetical protein AABX19_02885 [Nanoarchaeota archaeon]
MPSEKEKLRICPDEWYDNQMPCTNCNVNTRQYMIFNYSVERDLSKLDIEWIKANCKVNKPEVVS